MSTEVTKPMALDETLHAVVDAIQSLPNAGSTAILAENLADPYDSSASYAVGDLCVYEYALYKCNTAIGSGGEAWNAAHWTAVSVDELLTDLNGALSVLEPAATSGDVGKFLKAKTVSNGKVTEYEFGEGGGNIQSTTATLASASWSNDAQTVNVTGVTASNTVIISPSPSSMSDYTDAGIYCSAQGSGTLTFICNAVPSGNITVNVVIVG